MQHQFRVERKILKLVGATIRTYDPNGNQILRADQKGFKLREQIGFFTDDAKTQFSFGVKARQIIDFGATYDITGADGTNHGFMKRKGLKSSFVRDEWECYDAHGHLAVTVREESSWLGFLRRTIVLIALIAPQRYHVYLADRDVGTFQQNHNILAARYTCEVSQELVDRLGWSYVYAIPNLLAIIENKQG